ncbi:baseplate tail tube junction [Escherichia phage vB_EcoM_ESCO47]|nr:baseplate tail tube junction [Escherichia phage vB_EcoM_ESCO47]
MISVKEIVVDAKDLNKAIPVSESAGQSTKTETTTKTYVAQFPTGRAAGNDSTGDFQVTDLYKNGLLFTAYNMSARDSGSLRNLRPAYVGTSSNGIISDLTDNVKDAVTKFSNGLLPAGANKSTINKTPVANILLPRSKSDVDTTSHRFNDIGDSLITKGGGTATGVLSNIASTAVFGALDSITQGLMADNNEQIYTTSRSMYGGAENRTKVFTWDLTPRSTEDLMAIINIYQYFNYFSYGETGKSQYAQEIKSYLDEWYRSTFIEPMTPADAVKNKTLFEKITASLTNVLVVSNPTIWMVKNFGYTSKFDGLTDVFGPCQIQSVRFDKTPNGQFNGLAVAPNLPSTFTLEITMREIITLNRSSLYAGTF